MAVLSRPKGGSRSRAATRWRRAISLAVTAAITCASGSRAADPISLEDAVKATFILKFVPFVNWPASAPDTDTFNICTEGSDRVVDFLAQSAQGQDADGRHVAVRPLADGQPADGCRIVYIASDVPAAPLLQQLHARPVLSITQASNGDHGIIQLVTLNRHVTFDIDTKLAADGGITISSKLLGLAHAVTQSGSGP